MSAATILAPRTVEEAAENVREAARGRAVVLATGDGTKRTWTRPAAHDIELSTCLLSGVVAYEPGDGVITALAGTPWRELEAIAARGGHHLSPWIPSHLFGTVGGIVAAGQSGLDRLRYGPLRDHVLGMRVVMADGSIAKSGGRLVKNVTGFDLHRLHTGAHGTLGLVAEVSLRLHAAPEMGALALTTCATREHGLRLARAVERGSRAAWAVVVHDLGPESSPRWMVMAPIAGRAAVVESEVQALRAVCPELEWMVDPPGTLDERGVGSLWFMAGVGDLSRRSVRAACAATGVDAALAALDACGVAASITVQPALGIIDASIDPVDEAVVARVSAALLRAGARVHWRGLDDELRARVDLFGGEEPVGLALMRRIRANLDPNGLWASGRLAGGL